MACAQGCRFRRPESCREKIWRERDRRRDAWLFFHSSSRDLRGGSAYAPTFVRTAVYSFCCCLSGQGYLLKFRRDCYAFSCQHECRVQHHLGWRFDRPDACPFSHGPLLSRRSLGRFPVRGLLGIVTIALPFQLAVRTHSRQL